MALLKQYSFHNKHKQTEIVWQTVNLPNFNLLFLKSMIYIIHTFSKMKQRKSFDRLIKLTYNYPFIWEGEKMTIKVFKTKF